MKEFSVIRESDPDAFEGAMEQAFIDGWEPVAYFCDIQTGEYVRGDGCYYTAYLTREAAAQDAEEMAEFYADDDLVNLPEPESEPEPEPVDPAALEQKLNGLVEQYLIAEATLRNLRMNEPSMPCVPHVVTVQEFIAFQETQEAARKQIEEHQAQANSLKREIDEVERAIGQIIDRSPSIIVFAFGEPYSVWAGYNSYHSSSYRVEIAPCEAVQVQR